MTTSEKVAYLKGLAEGYGLDPEKKEGKILAASLDVLEDLALDQLDLSDSIDELSEGLDAVSDDLEDVEDILFGDVDEDEDEDMDDEDEGEAWDGETVFYECECPACGETVTFDEGVLGQGGIQCPACGEKLEFDLGEDEDDGFQKEESEE